MKAPTQADLWGGFVGVETGYRIADVKAMSPELSRLRSGSIRPKPDRVGKTNFGRMFPTPFPHYGIFKVPSWGKAMENILEGFHLPA